MKYFILVINIFGLIFVSALFGQDTIPKTGSNMLSEDNHVVIRKDKDRKFFEGTQHFPKLDSVQKRYLRWVDKFKHEFPLGTPLIAYNKYDGVQVGAGLINLKQPVKNVDFAATLFYGILSKKVTGSANIDYYLRPKKGVITEFKPGVNFKSFSYDNYKKPLKYYALSPELKLTFKHRSEKFENLEYQLFFKNHVIFNKALNYYLSGTTVLSKDTMTRFYANTLQFTFKREDKNFPIECTWNIEQTANFVKTSFTAHSFIRYQFKSMQTGIHLRFFAGGFIWRNSNYRFRLHPNVGYSLNGKTGEDDYLYDDYYIGRTEQEKFASRQISATVGNFKLVTPLNSVPIGQTTNGLFALNIKIDFPIQYVPLKLFFDMGYSVDKVLNPNNFLPVKGFQYDGGFMLSFLDEGFEVYFPLFMSKDYKTYYKSNAPKFKQRISFLLDIQKLQLHKKIRDLKF